MAKPRPSSKKEGLILVGIGVIFLGTLGLAFWRDKRGDNAPKQVQTNFGQVLYVGSTRNTGAAAYDVPGIGQVSAPGVPQEDGALAWFRVPPGSAESIQVVAEFAGRDRMVVPLHISSQSGIAWGEVPAFYPTEVNRCTLTVSRFGRTLIVWSMEGLPQSTQLFPNPPRPSTPAPSELTCGPARVRISLSRSNAPVTFLDPLELTLEAKMVDRPGERWGVVETNIEPMYSPRRRLAPPAKEPVDFSRGTLLDHSIIQVPVAGLQPALRISGRVVRYRVTDEPLSFRGLTVLNGSRENTDRRYVVPGWQNTASTPSGIQVTLVEPAPRNTSDGSTVEGQDLAFVYRITSAKGDSNRSTYFSLLDREGKALNSTKSQSSGLPGDLLVTRIPAPPKGGSGELQLTVRKRVDDESYPFSVVVPIRDLAGARR